MATVYRTVFPRAYARAFLRESVRADGRAPSRARKGTVLSGTNVLAQEQVYGAALVRVGTTAIIAGITAEIAEPKEDAPEEGYLGTGSATRAQRRAKKTGEQQKS